MDAHRRTIGEWLEAVSARRLALPSFQRENVWNHKITEKFLESIIIHPDRPVGVFLVLKTGGSSNFLPRYIDGGGGNTNSNYDELLLDGQQRLTALWESLKNNKDDGDAYYVEFVENDESDENDENFKVQAIKRFAKGSKKNKEYCDSPQKAFEQSLFPVDLLYPLEGDRRVDQWIDKLSKDVSSTPKETIKKVHDLIKETRKIFEKETPSDNRNLEDAYSIPFFKLTSDTDEKVAIEIYKSLNTNSVRLTDYYLAVAQMEGKTGKSLYDIADELDNKVKDLQSQRLESDKTGELILKIFCLMNGEAPSGGKYKDLPFKKLVLSKQKKAIFDGVEWAVRRLNDLKIWHGKQLPSTIPLRVLPALHQHYVAYITKRGVPRGEKSRREKMANDLINRYLWHTFLTKQYTGARVNDLLKKDYKALKQCLDPKLADIRKAQVPIFDAEKLTEEDIIKAGWPNRKDIIARGILLACCQEDAKDPISGTELKSDNAEKRQMHHIFPKSLFPKSRAVKLDDSEDGLFNPHLALNCLFISKDTNDMFDNHLPGTYLEKIYKPQNDSDKFNEDSVKANLKSHCISDTLSQTLINAKDGTLNDLTELGSAYKTFIEGRAEEVMKKINELLKNGK